MVAAVFAQEATVTGIILDKETGTPLDAASVYLQGPSETDFSITEEDGAFRFLDLPFGAYTLLIQHLAYVNDTMRFVLDQTSPVMEVEVNMNKGSIDIEEVEVVASPFRKPVSTPASIRSVGEVEIRTNPGSGSDIAKVMQILPGVATTSSFRNDLIIRGGAPSENSFYIDGFRIPVINHLSTQGASGGAVSMLNADFIREAELVSGNYPAARSNALSSVFNFNLQEKFDDGVKYRLSAGATNVSADAYGKLGDKVSFIGSVRRSYRQYILKLLGLAVYPVYNDFLGKLTYRPNPKQEISVLGIGAIDKFRVNEDADASEVQAYLVENLPLSDQWNYTVGAKHRLFTRNGLWEVMVSRSALYNKASRDVSTQGQEENTLRYISNELSHRFSTEYIHTVGPLTLRAGGELTKKESDFDVFNLFYDREGLRRAEYTSAIDYLFFGGHLQTDMELIPGRWTISAGFRMDASNFADQLENPLDQFSPRVSTAIKFGPDFRINAGWGIYYQLPGDLTLGYAIGDSLINQSTVRFVRSDQVMAGFEYELPWSGRISLEGFHKRYSNYPFNTREGISQANEGGDFGVAGNSPVISNGRGRSLGLEFMYEQKMFKNWFGTFSYTLSSSEFEDANGQLVPSSWDARHIVNAVIGKVFKRNWQAGLNVRYQSAVPYTPFDPFVSSFVQVWNVNRQGIRDFSRLNSVRGTGVLFADLRVDKKWDLRWGTFTFYLDIENLLSSADSQQVLVYDRTDETGNPVDNPVILNPEAPPAEQRYKLKELQNAEGTLIPTFGFILDF